MGRETQPPQIEPGCWDRLLVEFSKTENSIANIATNP